ncbi:MAG: membrane protein insertase YidC, partial [Spirochaetales bacterium]|nr:membrane protein insertase YidC [Spirochaetales bacterium]
IIAPIEMIVEWVFYFFVKIGAGGVISAVFGVSIVINFLALPLYNIADALQDKERQISRRLEPRLKRIRKAFKGDEQFMMVSTYYRQNNYHPLYVLRSSLSILIEIPFFIAAYHFLSHCPMLLGEHFWIFKDLGSPDRMWTITLGSLSLPINILPIIMTLINVVSAAVYTRGGTVKEKVQIYALAAVFLVLLYNSPSGLVIYWILNNIFSLCKNVIQKMKHPAAILCYIIGAGLILMSAVLFTLTDKGKPAEKAAVMIAGVFFTALPVLWDTLAGTALYAALSDRAAAVMKKSKSDFFIFLFSTLGLAVLLGLLLPASVISTSPTEFSFLGKTDSPFSYIHSSLWTFLGMCVFWPTVIYFMFGDKVKHTLTVIFPALLVCALCNVYVFPANYGDITPMFFVGDAIKLTTVSMLQSALSVLIMIAVIAIYYICRKINCRTYISVIIFSLCLGMTALGLYKSGNINNEYKTFCEIRNKSDKSAAKTNHITPVYHLSKDKQNVVVLFLDRALSSFVPYIMEEFPNLRQQFNGFTYYPNTLSFGRHTIIGSPSMMGGYEYTPDKINERSSELLKDKHNESALVMPKLFLDAGYDVTVTDMPLLDYQWEGFLSVFDNYPEIHADTLFGKQMTQYYMEKNDGNSQNKIPFDTICRDKIKFFSLVQCIHPKLRSRFYSAATCDLKQNQLGDSFIRTFSHLYFLRNLTDFTNDKPTYTFICNETPHEPTTLSVPEYDTLAQDTDIQNAYQPAYHSDDIRTNNSYQVNVAAMLQTAKWLNYLKANGVYDNTRIIIVADHGADIVTADNLYPTIPTDSRIDPQTVNPLLMFKDFNSNGELMINNSFMTNADTLFLAKQGLNISDMNPFTGKKLEQNKANGVKVYNENDWNHNRHKTKCKFEFNSTGNYIIRDNLFDPANWTPFNPNETNKE